MRTEKEESNMPTFRINGRKVTRARANAEFLKIDPGSSSMFFAQACEQSGNGYEAREYVEQCGITIRHDNEEQF